MITLDSLLLSDVWSVDERTESEFMGNDLELSSVHLGVNICTSYDTISPHLKLTGNGNYKYNGCKRELEEEIQGCLCQLISGGGCVCNFVVLI